MVVDAHPYVVNALAVCTATAEASAKVSAPMSDLMKRCLEEELPPACSPLPADSTFRALFNGEIRIHQGEPIPSRCTPGCMLWFSKHQDGAERRHWVSTFQALFTGRICIHQGEPIASLPQAAQCDSANTETGAESKHQVSAFRVLLNGDIRIHQGEPMQSMGTPCSSM